MKGFGQMFLIHLHITVGRSVTAHTNQVNNSIKMDERIAEGLAVEIKHKP